MKNRTVYALLPTLTSEVGHTFQYHVSAERALRSLGWKYFALVPEKTRIVSMPSDWMTILANDYWGEGKSLIFRLKILWNNWLIFRRFFAGLNRLESHVIFIENFELQHIASLMLALIGIYPKIQFWILHRYVFGKCHFKTVLYRFFHWFLEKKIGQENLRYLTDSELLAREQEKVFQKKIFVVPIPHTSDPYESEPMKKNGYLFWWPGGSIRSDKGLIYIQRLARALEKKPNVKLIVAEQAKGLLVDHSQIEWVLTRLSRSEYVRWMRLADVILLPYAIPDYAHRTSGIFVEAISLGAMPVVTRGTWMAYEFEKFGLDELAIDWSDEHLVEHFLFLRNKRSIQQRLEEMRNTYRNYHCEKSFSEAFEKLA